MISMAGLELPIRALRSQFASAVDLIIQASRLQGGPRKVTSISEVVGMEGDTIIMQEIFAFRQVGRRSQRPRLRRVHLDRHPPHVHGPARIRRATSFRRHLPPACAAERLRVGRFPVRRAGSTGARS